jgi:hypothetical protein
MRLIATLRQFFMNVERSRHMLEGIMAGVANQTEVINRHMMTLTEIADRRLMQENPEDSIAGRKSRNESEKSPNTLTQSVISLQVLPLFRVMDYEGGPDNLTHESIIAWRGSDRFEKAYSAFHAYPPHSLLRRVGRVMLYHIVRSMRPQNIIEVGTYFAGTSEVLTRALWENGDGVLHTTDPFGADRCPGIIARWPSDLRNHVRYYPLNSMEFFTKLENDHVSVDFAFIDGNHDFEFAYFDLCSAARLLRPGGIICLDNVEQPGPFWAVMEFLRTNPGWTEIGDSISGFDPAEPFVELRGLMGETDFIIIRAPSTQVVTSAPQASGQQRYAGPILAGLRGTLASPAPKGWLHIQVFLRAFDKTRDPEQFCAVTRTMLDGQTSFEVVLSEPMVTTLSDYYTAETVLFWQPDGHQEPLRLSAPVIPFGTGS